MDLVTLRRRNSAAVLYSMLLVLVSVVAGVGWWHYPSWGYRATHVTHRVYAEGSDSEYYLTSVKKWRWLPGVEALDTPTDSATFEYAEDQAGRMRMVWATSSFSEVTVPFLDQCE